MKDAVYHWLEQLACYLVLVTAVLHTLPDSGYKKYVRFFTALILILLLSLPVLKLFQADVSDWKTDLEEGYMSEIEEMGGMMEKVQEWEMEEKKGGMEPEMEAGVEVEEIKIGQ